MDKKYIDPEIEVVEVDDIITGSNELPVTPGGNRGDVFSNTTDSDFDQPE